MVSLIDFANIVVVCGKRGVERVKFCIDAVWWRICWVLICWFSFDFCFRMDFVGGGGWDFGGFES